MEVELLKTRRDKLAELRAKGVEPFPHRWKPSHSAAEAAKFGEGIEAEQHTEHRVRVAGRLIQVRVMGKASFAHILDEGTKLQIYVKRDLVGVDAYQMFKKDVHAGDFVGVEGIVFKTKTGETSVEASEITLLAKALRPLPEKWHGLKDTDTRYRKRHLDLIANLSVAEDFRKRSRIVSEIRATFARRGYMEVETPVLQAQAGGASARPFRTHHRALDANLFLRIATELDLKRLIIGGLGRVFEIGRIFRNEGIDTRHNPEFTTLECYEAYSDYHGMAELLEEVFKDASDALGIDEIEYRGMKVPLKSPFARLKLPELWREHCGADIHEILKGKGFDRKGLLAAAERLGVPAGQDTPSAKVFERIFDDRILVNLKEPAFVMDHPTAITPLAKCVPGDESLVERFEFFMGTEEVANAYTELNDPVDQRERLEEQSRQRAEGNAEADLLDEDFIEAMEHGMPPTGGMGIGIDRLAMILTGRPSIREVILFPTLKPETRTDPGGG